MTNTPTPRTGHDLPLSPALTARAFRFRRRVVTVALATLLAAGLPAEAARHPKAPRCAGGYFVVDGAPVVSGGTTPDAVLVGAGSVATLSGCPVTAAAKLQGSRRGDRLVVRWPACGAARSVSLQATIAADCTGMAGIVKTKGAKRRRLAAHQQTPPDMSAPWADRLPAGAQIVNPVEFLAASRQPGFRLLSPTTEADDAAAAAADDAANRATIAAFVAAHPERADLLSTGIDGNDPTITASGDGNYLVRLADGTQVVTMGPHDDLAVRAEAIRTFPAHDNQLAIYAQRHAFATQTLGMDLPSPDQAATLTADQLSALNAQVNARYPDAEAGAPRPGETLPDNYPSRCTNEIGGGDGTDGSAWCPHASDGLWNNVSWALKYDDTCIKNQAARGTCVDFAITAGREIQVVQKYGRWVNLSEQHLHYAAKSTYQPGVYGDGLDGSRLLEQMADNGYEQPLEQDWDYNPSSSRVANAKAGTYTNSCVGYGGDEKAYCSDTTGQGRVVCAGAGAAFICATTGAPAGAVTIHSTSQPAELWDASDVNGSITNVLYAVDVEQRPVVLGIIDVSSFDGVDANGFVAYDATRTKVCGTKLDKAGNPVLDASGNPVCDVKDDCQCSRGGHAILAVGYIRNGRLPEKTVSGATMPKGSGGGYVVVKNSWGCKGDGGYFYLPIDWMKSFVTSARALGDVESSAKLPDQPADDFHFAFTPVPPNVHVVEPAGERYVEGQQVPLVIAGSDFQCDGYALCGQTVWTSDIQGVVGTGTSTLASLGQGVHTLVVTYTGKTGAQASAITSVVVGPRPVNVPPTAVFTGYELGSGADCPVACDYNCILAYGYGTDPEDGRLTSDASVRWYVTDPNDGSTTLEATGASVFLRNIPISSKFLGCIRPCGGVYTFTLEVQDSAGQTAQARQELDTPFCVN